MLPLVETDPVSDGDLPPYEGLDIGIKRWEVRCNWCVARLCFPQQRVVVELGREKRPDTGERETFIPLQGDFFQKLLVLWREIGVRIGCKCTLFFRKILKDYVLPGQVSCP